MGENRSKILFVSSNFPPVVGGSSVVYDEICKNAPDEIIALSSRHNSETGERFAGIAQQDAGSPYRLYRLDHLRPPSSGKGNGTWSRVKSLLTVDMPVMTKTLGMILLLTLRYRVKVVCLGELVYLGWLVFPLRYLFRRKVVIYTHGEEISQNSEGIAARLRNVYLNQANQVISVSLFCKSLIVSKYKVHSDKISVLTNGVDTDRFHPAIGIGARDVFVPEIRSKKILLSVSRLVDRKGQDMLLAAMPTILQRVPDAHCVIVGDGPLAGLLKSSARRRGLEDSVSFLGKVAPETLANLYRAADLFVLPCHTLPDGDTEGFGLVFLEANACATPVVAGAAGGTVEAVIDGETGLIVNGTDPGQIADAVIKILTQPELARQFAAAGQFRTQLMNWPRISRSFVALCRDEKPPEKKASFRPVDWALEPSGNATPPRFLFTVDVEEEFSWSEFDRTDHLVRGLEGMETLQAACRRYGVSPVYLATHAMLMDDGFSSFLRRVREAGEAEVGLHLHPWITPPFWEEPNVFNSYQCNLPEHIERRKLETLARVFEERLGARPVLHRAGRWGGNERTNKILDEMGFQVDLSPSTGYADPDHGGPDFTNLDGRPFWAAGRHILTVPASSLNYLRGPNFLSTASFFWQSRQSGGRAPRILAGKAVRFSPEGQPQFRLEAMARQFVRMRLPVAVCSLHSTSLYGSGNPYARDQSEAEKLIARTAELMRYCIENVGMRPTTCAEIYREAVAGRFSKAGATEVNRDLAGV